MELTSFQLGQHIAALQPLLTSPIETNPRDLGAALDRYQSDLQAVGQASPHLETIRACIDRLSWGEDIAYQVCGGVMALLQMKSLYPRQQEAIDSLYQRFASRLQGPSADYQATAELSVSDTTRIERVTETASGNTYVRKTFEMGSSFGFASSGFYNEARFSTRIGRRAAVQPSDYGMTDDQKPFLIFENMAGDLRQTFDPHKPRDVHREAIKLTSLLLHLHVHRIIHRDIKPGNILVDAEGNYLLSDLGLAIYLDELAYLPRFCYTNGTPAYMTPESRRDNTDVAPNFGVDVYAMGLTLLETVTGRFLPRNFSGKARTSKLLGIRDEGWIRFFRRALEGDGNTQWQLEQLAAIVNKATAPDPSKRYSHGGEMFEEVHTGLRPGRMPIVPLMEAIRDSLKPSAPSDPDDVQTVVDQRQR